MKSKFGTALALVAVLLTGTAAAAINTQALISPTKSTLGTAATTLLPVDQAVAVDPAQGTNLGISPMSQSSSASPSQSSGTDAPTTQPASPAPAAGTPATTPSITSTTTVKASPSVIYGNPNPSNGDDEDEDEDEDEDDDEEDDD